VKEFSNLFLNKQQQQTRFIGDESWNEKGKKERKQKVCLEKK